MAIPAAADEYWVDSKKIEDKQLFFASNRIYVSVKVLEKQAGVVAKRVPGDRLALYRGDYGGALEISKSGEAVENLGELYLTFEAIEKTLGMKVVRDPGKVTVRTKESSDAPKRPRTGLRVGDAIHDVTLTTHKGEALRFSDLKQKRIALALWTSAGPGRDDLAAWEALYKKLKNKNVVLISAAEDVQAPDVVAKYLPANAEHRLCLDPSNKLASMFGVKDVPAWVFIDEIGFVLAIESGGPDEEKIRGWLDEPLSSFAGAATNRPAPRDLKETEKLLKNDADNTELLLTWSEACVREGDLESAAGALERILEKSANARLLSAHIRVRQGKPAQVEGDTPLIRKQALAVANPAKFHPTLDSEWLEAELKK